MPKGERGRGRAKSKGRAQSLANYESLRPARRPDISVVAEQPTGEEIQFPRRPGYGKVGRPINLRANFFVLTLPQNDLIYHYDVTITPEAVKHVHREIMELVYKKYAGEAFGKARPAFDGSRNLYTMKDLPVGRDGVCILPP